MKKKNRMWIYPLIIGILLLFMNCSKKDKDDDSNDYCVNQSKIELEKYIADSNISDQYKMKSGLYYIPDTVGTGLSPEVGNYIVISYTGWYTDGTIIETTDSAMKSKWSQASLFTNYVYGSIKILYGYSRPGFNEGLSYMSEDGWSTLIMNTELAFYDCRPVIYKINLISVIKDPVAYEKAIMLKCLADNGMDTISNAYKNIYYKELVTSPDIQSVALNDTVLIRFTGKYTYKTHNDPTIKFRVFDSNIDKSEPLKIVYGDNEYYYGGSALAMPNGFAAALDTMCKGTRALAIIPYTQAFGVAGLADLYYYYIIVPAYQTVIYEIWVEDIKPGVVKK
jgi:FKBP-type peptidyl-prolyl cis-trans isomerase